MGNAHLKRQIETFVKFVMLVYHVEHQTNLKCGECVKVVTLAEEELLTYCA